MWGESSKDCEVNCQCSGLITESFKINSGNNSKKRKQEEAVTSNYKYKMNPHSLDFTSRSPLSSPVASKRRILGEIQNLYLPKSPLIGLKSPLIKKPEKSPFDSIRPSTAERLQSLTDRSPLTALNSLIDRSPLTALNTPLIDRKSPINRDLSSPLTSRTVRSSADRSSTDRCKRSKISRIFEERSKFKMSNKENSPFLSETFMKIDVEEETRDCSFGERFPAQKMNWSMTKLDFTDALPSKSFEEPKETKDLYVPQEDSTADLDHDFDTLHDLEEEFEGGNFDQCTKYEIISTDSPNIISRGRSTSRKISSSNFVFGAPLSDVEQSTSFNKPTSATRMLNFEDENFEFTSPAAKRPSSTSLSVKKSLKFTETPTKTVLRHERSDSSIGSMTSPATKLRIFPSESTTSMESGFISELEEPFLDMEEVSNSPKISNFDELISGQIKENFLQEKEFSLRRPAFQRSLSFNPEASKARVSLFSIKESPKKTQKREREAESGCSKRRKSNCQSPEVQKARPVLQRAFSENNASIMSALARSVVDPDLIGDFSLPFALPLTSGDHSDLKSISCDTLASLLRGEYEDSINDFQVIDCRYPYEFEGGHIAGARNLYTPAQVLALVNERATTSSGGGRSILVFHCEFSLERGPKLSRFLRSTDRAKNKDHYPALHYPEVYLLHEGYRAFYRKHPQLCTPAGYTAMLDPKHRDLLRKHRSDQPGSSGRRNRLLL